MIFQNPGVVDECSQYYLSELWASSKHLTILNIIKAASDIDSHALRCQEVCGGSFPGIFIIDTVLKIFPEKR